MSLHVDGVGTPTLAVSPHAPQQIISFLVNGRYFGIPVNEVREIKGWQQTTALPNTDPSVMGVINLRGQVLPVFDLRITMGLEPSEATRSSVIIVVDVNGRAVGILADSVSDILDVSDEEVRPSPMGNGRTDLVSRLVIKSGTLIALINTSLIAAPASN